jgi:hypothetical protein
MLLTRPSKNVYRQHRPKADLGQNSQVKRPLTALSSTPSPNCPE